MTSKAIIYASADPQRAFLTARLNPSYFFLLPSFPEPITRDFAFYLGIPFLD